MNENTHLLVVDDEDNYLLVLEALLSDAGYKVTTLNDPKTALEYLNDSEVDVVITDMKMPHMSGGELMVKIKKSWPHIPVLIMTAFGSIESAVDLMKQGANNYITKPFSNDELLLAVKNAAELAHARRQLLIANESLGRKYGKDNMIGNSRQMREMMSIIDRVSPTKATVLITGESGTGKELVAHAIHYGSQRSKGPFISVNCAALNHGVLESELFGHEKGSFTGAIAMRRGKFEQADGGTLFLDEIGDISLDLQVKLLRVLQEHKIERVGGSGEIDVDIRVITATNRNLQEMVLRGEFREDLYYRLNVVNIAIPPLRARREDIPLLVGHFVETLCKENHIPVKRFTPEAINYLIGYEWPGNVRQLQNIVERCVVLNMGDEITIDALPAEIKDEESQFSSAVDLLPPTMDLAETLDHIEGAIIRRALIRANFVQSEAAKSLNISKSLMQYKLKKYSITGH